MSATRGRAGSQPDLQGYALEEPSSQIRPLVPLFAVPHLTIAPERIRFMPLDARDAYLLSLADGQCTVETILDVCGMDRDAVLGALARLLDLGAIELRDP